MHIEKVKILSYFIFLLSCCNVQKEWQHPITMDQTKKEVQAILGEPDFIPPNTNISWYPESGLSIEFDEFDQISRINFAGPTPENVDVVGTKWIPTKYNIYKNINVFNLKTQLLKQLGSPYKIEDPIFKASDKIYFWKVDDHIFEVEFWKNSEMIRTLSVRKCL